MTPYEIDLLLHLNGVADPHRTHGETLWSATIDRFLADGLVRVDASSANSHSLTERGKALVAMLCATPLPVASYIDPRTLCIAGVVVLWCLTPWWVALLATMALGPTGLVRVAISPLADWKMK